MLGLRGWGSCAAHNGGSLFGMLGDEFMRIDFRLTKCVIVACRRRGYTNRLRFLVLPARFPIESHPRYSRYAILQNRYTEADRAPRLPNLPRPTYPEELPVAA